MDLERVPAVAFVHRGVAHHILALPLARRTGSGEASYVKRTRCVVSPKARWTPIAGGGVGLLPR